MWIFATKYGLKLHFNDFNSNFYPEQLSGQWLSRSWRSLCSASREFPLWSLRKMICCGPRIRGRRIALSWHDLGFFGLHFCPNRHQEIFEDHQESSLSLWSSPRSSGEAWGQTGQRRMVLKCQHEEIDPWCHHLEILTGQIPCSCLMVRSLLFLSPFPDWTWSGILSSSHVTQVTEGQPCHETRDQQPWARWRLLRRWSWASCPRSLACGAQTCTARGRTVAASSFEEAESQASRCGRWAWGRLTSGPGAAQCPSLSRPRQSGGAGSRRGGWAWGHRPDCCGWSHPLRRQRDPSPGN